MFIFKLFHGASIREKKSGLQWMETHSSQKTDSYSTLSAMSTQTTEYSHSSNISQPSSRNSSTLKCWREHGNFVRTSFLELRRFTLLRIINLSLKPSAKTSQ